MKIISVSYITCLWHDVYILPNVFRLLFVVLASEYCGLFSDGTPVLTAFSLERFLALAVAVLSVFILSFGPFIVNVRNQCPSD